MHLIILPLTVSFSFCSLKRFIMSLIAVSSNFFSMKSSLTSLIMISSIFYLFYVLSEKPL